MPEVLSEAAGKAIERTIQLIADLDLDQTGARRKHQIGCVQHALCRQDGECAADDPHTGRRQIPGAPRCAQVRIVAGPGEASLWPLQGASKNRPPHGKIGAPLILRSSAHAQSVCRPGT